MMHFKELSAGQPESRQIDSIRHYLLTWWTAIRESSTNCYANMSKSATLRAWTIKPQNRFWILHYVDIAKRMEN
jgi:hypothetical protein